MNVITYLVKSYYISTKFLDNITSVINYYLEFSVNKSIKLFIIRE